MNQDKPNSPDAVSDKKIPQKTSSGTRQGPPEVPLTPRLFRRIDWISFVVTTLLVFIGYYLTLAPDLTLEDSGELAVGSFYAGVPHPPGYPVWTIYSWLFTKLVPISNIAWRVGLSSAVAGAFACGLIALMVSRGSSMMLEGIPDFKDIERRWENALCFVSGLVAGLLLGFAGFMWSQAVIVEVYTLSVLSMTALLVFLLRWMHAPDQKRYLYWAFFMFGICITNHQTLIVAAMGLEIAIAAVRPKLGRDLFLCNTAVYFLILVLKDRGYITTFNSAEPGQVNPLFVMFNFIGIGSGLICAYLTIQTRKLGTEMLTVVFAALLWILGAAFYFYMPVASMTNPPLNWGYPRTAEGFLHALSRGQYEKTHATDDASRFVGQVGMYIEGAIEEFNLVYLIIGLLPFVIFAIQIAREGGKRDLSQFGIGIGVMVLFFGGILMADSFQLRFENYAGAWKRVSLVFAIFSGLSFLVSVLLFIRIVYKYMQKPERAWLVGLTAIYLTLAVLLLILLNPSTDRQSRELTKVFFTSSHIIIAMAIGYGLTFFGALIATRYKQFRWVFLTASFLAAALALYVVAVVYRTGEWNIDDRLLTNLIPSEDPLVRFASIFALVLAVVGVLLFALRKTRMPMIPIIALFAIMPTHMVVSHWSDNEQRGHRFGYWFGHDMFIPPYDIHPEIPRDTVIFGGTDPGRFNPTYMIFCEGFIPPEERFNPGFDRRDCYLITQNALADGTYLSYIRAHYNRSAQIDPPFFSEFFPKYAPGFLKRPITKMMEPLDKFFLALGDDIEKERRAGTSFFKEDHFLDLKSLAGKLREHKDPVSDYVFQNLKPQTQALLSGSDDKLRGALAKDLNAILEKPALPEIPKADAAASDKTSSVTNQPLYSPERFENVKLSDHSQRFIKENPQGHTRIRWNRLLLEDAYGKEIAKSKGGVYPDLEIKTPTPEDSQRAFNEYIEDAQRRYQLGQMKPGEDFRVEGGRVQVSGQVAVMSINGILTKMIFDANPGHDFYVEESFPLDWMYPYLSPSGIIMKINRNPLPELTQEMIDKDHQFWSKYSDRLIGNWITYDTSVKDICDFAERIYLHHDYKGFKGDPKFARDDNAQKAFSKLRSSIGGIYAWRVGSAKSPAEQQRMIKEADFTFKQAFAYCPFSPEAVYRYVNLLLTMRRFDDAIAIVKTCQKLDPDNGQIDSLLAQVEQYKGGGAVNQSGQVKSAIGDVVRLMQNKQTNEAVQALNHLLSDPDTDASTLMSIAQMYVQLGVIPGAELAVQKVTVMTPGNPEAWYNLGGLQAAQGKIIATQALEKAFTLGDLRRKKDPKAIDLRAHAKADPNLEPIRNTPEFQKLVGK